MLISEVADSDDVTRAEEHHRPPPCASTIRSPRRPATVRGDGRDRDQVVALEPRQHLAATDVGQYHSCIAAPIEQERPQELGLLGGHVEDLAAGGSRCAIMASATAMPSRVIRSAVASTTTTAKPG